MEQRYGFLLLVAAGVLQLALVTPVAAQDADAALSDDYVGGNFGRLLYQENGVTVRRASPDSNPTLERVAGLNAPIFPGDGLITAFDQRAEIQLAGGSLVRVDRATEVTFLALPDPYAEIADNTVLQLEQGVIRLSVLLADDSEFRIDTPTGTILLLDDAELRIEVDRNGVTLVASLRGVVEVSAENSSVLVRSGTRTAIYPGQAPESAHTYNTLRGDGFDRWVNERDAEIREFERLAENDDAYDEIPDEVRPYYRELSRDGRWIYNDEFGWTWSPSRVSADWSPYSDGYWAYGSRGYFWVSHERWGWAPYHYGRWSYVGSYGWCWIPGRVFGGAWVAWSWGSAYVGWSPLGYWNTAYCGTPWGYSYGYYGPSWTFVNYNHIHYRNYRRYAVPYNRIGRDYLVDTAVVTRPPRIHPNELARSAETRERAVREARADRTAHLRPVTDEVRNARTNLRGVEQRLAAGRGARATEIRERGAGRTVSDRVATANRDAVVRGSSKVRSGAIVRSGRSNETARSTPTRATRTQDRDTQRRRMRDVYERMSSPRSTQPRSSDSTRSTSRSTTRPSRPTAAPSRSGTSRGSKATAPRQRSGSSGSKATAPRQRSGSSGSKAAAPRQRSGSSGSKAAAPRQRSGSSGGGKSAAPKQRSGSSGGGKSAAPRQRSGSSGGGKSAAPRPRSGGSSGKAAPRSSGRKKDKG